MKLTYDNPDNLQEIEKPVTPDNKGLAIPVHTDVGLQQSLAVRLNTDNTEKENNNEQRE